MRFTSAVAFLTQGLPLFCCKVMIIIINIKAASVWLEEVHQAFSTFRKHTPAHTLWTISQSVGLCTKRLLIIDIGSFAHLNTK